MKKFFSNLKGKTTDIAIRTKTTIENKKTEDYVDSGVKILIFVVIGAILLTVCTYCSTARSCPT